MTEVWKSIAGVEGDYEVSSLGNVRSLKYGKERLLKLYEVTKGYLAVDLCKNGMAFRKSVKVHVLVAESFLGIRPEGLVIRHLDGDNTNNDVTNLEYGTPHQNQQDSVLHGTHVNTKKTHCPMGHEYTEENTRICNKGKRNCRACARYKTRERRRREKEKWETSESLSRK